MVFDKIKEMITGALEENLSDISGITDQLGGLEEGISTISETPISEIGDTLSQNIEDINPQK